LIETGGAAQNVSRIEREAPVTTSEPDTLIRQRGVGRPPVATPWTATIERWLAEDRGLPSSEMVRRLRAEHGYTGGKSAIYDLVRRLRPIQVTPVVPFEVVAGEFSEHNFGKVEIRYTTGHRERVRFFASRLTWSRFTHVTLVADQREEALIRALLAAFEAFGGVPLVTIWNNLKTVVLSRQGDLIVWNPIVGQVALDYRFALELCGLRAAQQKSAAVENLVGLVKGRFFRGRRFHDRADLEAQLAQWLTTVNTERPSRTTGEIPAHRLGRERERLRPLPVPAAAYALKIPVVVSARGRVRHDGREYSMPPETLGQAATLHLYPDHVEIVPKMRHVVRPPDRPHRA
jgi:transposase